MNIFQHFKYILNKLIRIYLGKKLLELTPVLTLNAVFKCIFFNDSPFAPAAAALKRKKNKLIFKKEFINIYSKIYLREYSPQFMK